MSKPAHGDGHEIRIGFRGHNSRGVSGDPEEEPRYPEAKPERQRGGDGADQDRGRPWRAAHKDRLGQRAVQRDFVAVHETLRSVKNGAAAEREEGEEEARRSEGDGEPEYDLDQLA